MNKLPIKRYIDKKRTNPYLQEWATTLVEHAEAPEADYATSWNGNERYRGWKEARAARITHDGGRCTQCGSTENLHVHHMKKRLWHRRLNGHDELEQLRTLCQDCHVEQQRQSTVYGNGAPGAVKVARPVRRGA